MPIEIRELIIKATVENEGNNALPGQDSEQNSSEASLTEIAEKVFAIIKEKMER